MIKIKKNADLQKIKKSGAILAEIKQIIYDALQPGKSTQEINELAHKEIIKRNVKPAFLNYHGFNGTICISINEEMIHGIPSPHKIIKEGDLVKVDCGVIYEGFYSDSAFTKSIGEKKIFENERLIRIAKEAFYEGFKIIKPGFTRVGDIGYAIETFLKANNVFFPYGFTGHGIGRNLHEEPSIPNYGKKNKGPIIKNGMAICIEPMILQNSHEVKILNDGWTVISKDRTKTSHYEHTIIIENNKAKIVTGGI